MSNYKTILINPLPTLDEKQKENTINLITALRSGKFIQGSGPLKQINNRGKIYYCCLGLGSEILNVKNSECPCGGKFSFDYEDYSDCEEPSNKFWRKEYGWDFHQLVVIEFEKEFSLIQLNDGFECRGFSFDELAAIIEACFIDFKVIEFS